MFKRSCLIAVAAASLALVTPALSFDWGPGHDKGELCAVLEAGGGPWFFSSRNALRTAVGNARTDEEIKKLEAQFGEGRVYRFFAVGDFMMKDAYRICNLHYGTMYKPRGVANVKGLTDSRLGLDKMMGTGVHEMVMKNADERFGAGASDNFHTIADQLAKNLG